MPPSQSHLRFSECAGKDADIFAAKSKEQGKAFSVNSETPFLFEEVSQHRAYPYKAKPSIGEGGEWAGLAEMAERTP
jgi:hypothetical protein